MMQNNKEGELALVESLLTSKGVFLSILFHLVQNNALQDNVHDRLWDYVRE